MNSSSTILCQTQHLFKQIQLSLWALRLPFSLLKINRAIRGQTKLWLLDGEQSHLAQEYGGERSIHPLKLRVKERTDGQRAVLSANVYFSRQLLCLMCINFP